MLAEQQSQSHEEGQISSELNESKNQQKGSNANRDSNGVNKKPEKKHGKQFKMISTSYKTKRCQFYNKGACGKGDQCTFSHDFIPEASKKMCKFFLTGACTKGDKCSFSHDTRSYPCRFHHLERNCRAGMQCRFSHEAVTPEAWQQYLKDNQEYLIQLYNAKRLCDWSLVDYVISNKLLEQQNDTNPNRPLIDQQSKSPPRVQPEKNPIKTQVEKSPIRTIQKPVDPRLRMKQNKQQIGDKSPIRQQPSDRPKDPRVRKIVHKNQPVETAQAEQTRKKALQQKVANLTEQVLTIKTLRKLESGDNCRKQFQEGIKRFFQSYF